MSLPFIRLARDFNSLIGQRRLANDIALALDSWEEGKHPRAENGQFGSSGAGSASQKPERKSKGMKSSDYVGKMQHAINYKSLRHDYSSYENILGQLKKEDDATVKKVARSLSGKPSGSRDVALSNIRLWYMKEARSIEAAKAIEGTPL